MNDQNPESSTYGSYQNLPSNVPNKYEYRPLDPLKNEIRLIRLTPASNTKNDIHCQLFHASLDNAPPYQALSYTWGSLEGSSPVFVDGKFILGTRNLRHALNRLRQKQEEENFNLWVDAICINQEDIIERSMQTSKMRQIYRKSQSVLVWLGLENNGSSGAIQLVRDLNNIAKDEVAALLRDPSRAGHIKALVVLFRRQYWWRIWVIQEISCANHAVVYCGSESLSWSTLENVCDILKAEEQHLQDIFYDTPSYTHTLLFGGPRGLQLSRYSPTANAPPLLELLYSHKSKKSTDPRDKVYALVGLSSSRKTFGSTDYSRSIREVYTQTVTHIISTSQKLDVICVKQHDINQYGLPSWAPDWTRPPPHPEHTVVGLQHSGREFAAAAYSLANTEFTEDGYVLKAAGVVIDTVTAAGRPFKRNGAQHNVAPALKFFHKWGTIFIGARGKSTAEQGVFCRTISCGKWTSEDETSYSAKLKDIYGLSRSLLPDFPLDQHHFISPSDIIDAQEEDTKKAQLATALSASLTMNKRRLVIGDLKTVGLAPWNSAEGDIICVLFGCRFPVILRRQDESHFILVGEAYIDGYMTGEAMKKLEDGTYRAEIFEIR